MFQLEKTTQVNCTHANTRTDGTLWAWGYNTNGQLGSTKFANLLEPTQVGKGKDWLDVAAGSFHTLAVKKDGTLWAWGRNASGQLGDGTTSDNAGEEVYGGLDVGFVDHLVRGVDVAAGDGEGDGRDAAVQALDLLRRSLDINITCR